MKTISVRMRDMDWDSETYGLYTDLFQESWSEEKITDYLNSLAELAWWADSSHPANMAGESCTNTVYQNASRDRVLFVCVW